MIDLERIPQHVAIIMDGNGRWAQSKNLPRMAGHNAGNADDQRNRQGFFCTWDQASYGLCFFHGKLETFDRRGSVVSSS